MKSLKERLEEKIEKDAKEFQSDEDRPKRGPAGSYKEGAASLVPLVVELADCLSKISKQKYGLQGYIEENDNEGAYSYMSQLAFGYEADARKALQSIEKFLEGNK
jgi:hypothetical protein